MAAEEERDRHEQVIVAYNEIAYYFVVGTTILAVFAVAHLIPGTSQMFWRARRVSTEKYKCKH